MSHFKNRIDLIKAPSFRNYVISCAFAMFGNGLTYVTMTWLLLKLQHQISAVAILMTCFWVPNIVLGPIAGVIVDNCPRRYILLFCNISRGLILAGFWEIYPDDPPAYAIYVLAAILGSILALYIPSAMTFVRELVTKQRLLYANATVDMAYEIGAVAGMGASGFIIALTSMHTTFIINALTYLLATFFMFYAKESIAYQKPKKSIGIFHDLKSGLYYLIYSHQLLVIYLIQMCFFVSYMTAPILLAPYAKSVLHTTAGQFGAIEATLSLGAVLGGVFTPYLSECFGFKKVIVIETLMSATSFFIFSHNYQLSLAIFCYFFIGFCFSAWPLLITAAQDRTEFNYQGRVQALFNSVSGILILIFYMLLGFAGDYYSLASLYWLEIGLMGLSMMLLLWFEHQHNHH